MENERIARLEATMEKIEKGFDTAVEKWERGFDRLEVKIDSLFDHIEQRYVPRSEFEQIVKRLEEQITDVEAEQAEMKSKHSRYLSLTVTSIVAIVAALISAYLGK